MQGRLRLEMLPQPDDTTCGPTCLHAVYRYFGDDIAFESVIEEVPALEGGGTLAVLLGCHALRRGYRATVITYNLQVFDPSWFTDSSVDLKEKLRLQRAAKDLSKLRVATDAYLEFLQGGGRILQEDLNSSLIRRYLRRGTPMLTGLSATYLYRSAREFGPKNDQDDIRGEPVGHFVVLCGLDRQRRKVLVADPYGANPLSADQHYSVDIDRVIGAVFLGVLTYDANLLVIKPGKRPAATR